LKLMLIRSFSTTSRPALRTAAPDSLGRRVRSAVRRRARRCAIVNRTQALVLGFFLTVMASLVVIRAAAPEVYNQALRLPPSWPRWAGIAFLLALTAFIALLAVGDLRRWRWTFWLILLAFLAGVLRVPVAILQLAGVLPANVPSWYVVFQGLIGLAQLAIGLTMLADYRRAGVWGAA
jgi:cell division protein FtsW (lipid II flippase)